MNIYINSRKFKFRTNLLFTSTIPPHAPPLFPPSKPGEFKHHAYPLSLPQPSLNAANTTTPILHTSTSSSSPRGITCVARGSPSYQLGISCYGTHDSTRPAWRARSPTRTTHSTRNCSVGVYKPSPRLGLDNRAQRRQMLPEHCWYRVVGRAACRVCIGIGV